MLTYITSRTLDDLLYYVLTVKPGKVKELEGLNLSENFLEEVYNFYLKVEEENIVFGCSERRSGYSTGLAFLVAFYGLRYKKITILTLPNPEYRQNMFKLMKGFYRIIGASPEVDVSLVNTNPNNVYIAVNDSESNSSCDINFLSSSSYKSADLGGLVFFDNAGVLRNENIQKLEGLIESMDEEPRPHDRIVMNFIQNKVYDNLVETYSKKIQITKFYNG